MSLASRRRVPKFQSVPSRAQLPAGLEVNDILRLPGFRDHRVISGSAGLTRPVDQVNVIQIPTNRFVKPNEVVLTAAVTLSGFAGDLSALMLALCDKGISALGIRGQQLEHTLGPDALRVADEQRLPLFELPATTHLSELQTQVLELIVSVRTRQMRSTESIKSRLAQHVLGGGGLDALPQAIGEVTQGDVALIREDGEVLSASSNADPANAVQIAQAYMSSRRTRPVRTDDGMIVWPVVLGRRRLGCLVAWMPDDYQVTHQVALQQGADYAALQILHREEAAEATERLKSGFIADLLTGSLTQSAALRRAGAVGWPPYGAFRAMLVGTRSGLLSLQRRLREHAPQALVMVHGDACLVILPLDEAGEDATPPGTYPAFIQEVEQAAPGAHIGVSAQHSGLQELSFAVMEAEEAFRAATIFDRRTRVRSFDELGPLQLLSWVPSAELRSFERAILRPFDRLDTAYRSTLIQTLDLLVQNGLNMAETARYAGCHYNTVRNRILRLTELLGPFTEDGVTLDAIRLALMIKQELGVDESPNGPPDPAPQWIVGTGESEE